jgi:hypothetical protein
MGCEMADSYVVVSKSDPMKAGKSLEGKTRMSMRARKKLSRITCFHSKRGKAEAKGTCFVKVCEFA